MNDPKELEKNFYEILNVSKEASFTDIKKSYKTLLLKYHPDINKDNDSSEHFIRITKAYSVLKDDLSRAEYDESLSTSIKSSNQTKFQYSYHDFFKIKDDIFNVFKIFFKNISGKKLPSIRKDDYFFWDGEIDEGVLKMSAKELEERLLYSDNLFVKINAAIALGIKEEKSLCGVLENMLSDPSDDVKKAVIWALGNLKMKKNVSMLKILYENSPIGVKIEILRSIYKIEEGKSTVFYKLLTEAVNGSNMDLKKEALKLLLKIDNKILYDDVKEIFKNGSGEIKVLLDRIIAENKIINYPGRT